MNSKENVFRLISLYKSVPQLWNTNHTTHLKLKAKRLACIQKIATKLEEDADMKIPAKQLNKVIAYLRRCYKAKLENEYTADQEGSLHSEEHEQQSQWFCQHLTFLKPFLEKNPLAVLDNYSQDLKPEQIVQILNIYKRCPCLWDTGLLESYCHNKRSEGFQQMLELVQLEMNIKVNEKSIEKYVHSINVNFSREKRRHMGIIQSEEEHSEYFEHMMFLYDHLGPFQCSECRRKFHSLLHLKAHKYEHDGIIPFKCSMCSKGFKNVETYIYHIRRHMNDLNKSCKECGKSFLKASELKSHMRSHTGAKPYCCEFCGAAFRHTQVLNVHRKRHEKKFTSFCPTCSKGFYTKCQMDIHQRTHKEDREFACPTCGKAFKTRKNLQQHEYTHAEGRNHVCTICTKAFKNKMNLTQHVKLHMKKGSLDPEFKSKLNSVFD